MSYGNIPPTPEQKAAAYHAAHTAGQAAADILAFNNMPDEEKLIREALAKLRRMERHFLFERQRT